MINWKLQNTVLPSVLLIAATIVVFSVNAVAGDNICRDAGLTGKGFGLCTAYCEAMDCDSENPNANETACVEVQTKFLAETGLSSLPCGDGTGEPPVPDLECPCDFDAEEVRASLSDELTYPYVTCIRQRNLWSIGTAEQVRLYSSDEPELYDSSKFVGLTARSFFYSSGGSGEFNCTAEKFDIDTGYQLGRPYGYLSLWHNYDGERWPAQESYYQSCKGSFDALVIDVFPDLECSDTTMFEVTIAKFPDESYGCVPYTLQFQISEVFGGESPYSVLWDFGDGNTSTQSNPIHTYTEPSGTFDNPTPFIVELTVTDVNGFIGEAETHVYVAPTGYCQPVSCEDSCLATFDQCLFAGGSEDQCALEFEACLVACSSP